MKNLKIIFVKTFAVSLAVLFAFMTAFYVLTTKAQNCNTLTAVSYDENGYMGVLEDIKRNMLSLASVTGHFRGYTPAGNQCTMRSNNSAPNDSLNGCFFTRAAIEDILADLNEPTPSEHIADGIFLKYGVVPIDAIRKDFIVIATKGYVRTHINGTTEYTFCQPNGHQRTYQPVTLCPTACDNAVAPTRRRGIDPF